jgi:hypothetical protein
MNVYPTTKKVHMNGKAFRNERNDSFFIWQHDNNSIEFFKWWPGNYKFCCIDFIFQKQLIVCNWNLMFVNHRLGFDNTTYPLRTIKSAMYNHAQSISTQIAVRSDSVLFLDT